LFKLPTRDAHARILPAVERLKKQKRRDTFHRGALRNHRTGFNVPARFGSDPVCQTYLRIVMTGTIATSVMPKPKVARMA
jgi:hypothetical protein